MLKKNTSTKSFNAAWLIILLFTVFMVQCKKDDSNDNANPTVLATTPADGEINVVTSQKISVLFSKVMDTATINNTTFLLKQGGIAVAGLVSYTDSTATFTPASFWAPQTVYSGTITTGATDNLGNALQTDFSWSFTTGATSNPDVPRVTKTNPENNESSVRINQKVAASFSEVMDASSLTAVSFLVKNGSTSVTGAISYSGTTAIFAPASNLSANTKYTATISTGVKDLTGTALASNYTWSFTTGSTVDAIAPTVTSTDPINATPSVPLNKVVSVRFSEFMDPLTISDATFSISNGAANVAGVISYTGTTAVFSPTANWVGSTTYTATVTTAAKDLAGNALANNYTFTFTTGTTSSQPVVNLGSAGNFVILSGSGITSTGQTVVNGDIGTSPTGTIDGFPPGVVYGNIHAADPIAAQAKLDLTTAFNEVQSRANGAISLPGDISGLTFTPGLYSNSTSVMLSAGNATLDAQGDVNAIFIFQMGSTLTTSPGTQLILSGGAQAKNIYWSVGTSATLGTNSVFSGNILADQSISLNTGAVLNGRALTRIAAVTFQGNTVNHP